MAAPTKIDIPVDDWRQIKSSYVKWGVFHYTLDGENWSEIDLQSNISGDAIDWKRPGSVEIIDALTKEILIPEEES